MDHCLERKVLPLQFNLLFLYLIDPCVLQLALVFEVVHQFFKTPAACVLNLKGFKFTQAVRFVLSLEDCLHVPIHFLFYHVGFIREDHVRLLPLLLSRWLYEDVVGR